MLPVVILSRRATENWKLGRPKSFAESGKSDRGHPARLQQPVVPFDPGGTPGLQRKPRGATVDIRPNPRAKAFHIGKHSTRAPDEISSTLHLPACQAAGNLYDAAPVNKRVRS
jgi:hypothetical protein